MNIFIDTEFSCLPWEKNSELISIGLVLEDGSEYYGCSADFNSEYVSEFVKSNVLRHLPDNRHRKSLVCIRKDIEEFIAHRDISAVWAVFPSRDQIGQLYQGKETADEIYRKFADWDFQLLRSLIVDIDKLPSRCEDLSLLIRKHKKFDLPTNRNAHNALEDARWNFEVWKKYA